MNNPPYTGKTFLCLLCISVFSAFYFISCADTEPSILTVKSSVVFDFADKQSVPTVRFSVFVQPGKEVQRVRTIKVTCAANGYEWIISNPSRIVSDKGQWAGSTQLVPRYSEEINQGVYTVTYTDKADHSVDSTFSIVYPEGLIQAKAADVPGMMGGNRVENIAMYAENGKLLYYGPRKKNWNSDADIWNGSEDAVQMRICWCSSDESVICLMPPVHK